MHQAQGEGVGWNQQRQGRALTTLGGRGVYILPTSPAISNSSHHLHKPDVTLWMRSPRLQEVKVSPPVSGEAGVENGSQSLDLFSDTTLSPSGARHSRGYVGRRGGWSLSRRVSGAAPVPPTSFLCASSLPASSYRPSGPPVAWSGATPCSPVRPASPCAPSPREAQTEEDVTNQTIP